MRIENPSKEELEKYNNNLLSYITKFYPLKKILYLDLGVKTVRLECYSDLFIPYIEKQFTYTLVDEPNKYDATIVLWNERDIENLYKYIIPEISPKTNFKKRIEMIMYKITHEEVWIFSDNYSKTKPLLSTDVARGIVKSYNPATETYFYGVKNLEPEEFIKEGHAFVQILNDILKTDDASLVHGACVGLNNIGILFCARGQRGKSTLAVLAMMKGFEYVSDDYLTLEKDKNNLFAYPIYSIITLSPRMYNELYGELEGCRFVSNNARKDKYVINISKFHDNFRKKYPVKLCMFPEIVSDTEPSVKECSQREKGRAIIHLVHSTIFQMFDTLDIKTIRKIILMVKNFSFYKINLCNDIHKNVECLKSFIENIERENKNELLQIE